MTSTDKPVTVRLPPDVLTHLMGLSIIDDTNLAEQLRKAATHYVTSRRSAAGFAEEVKRAQERQTKALDALT